MKSSTTTRRPDQADLIVALAIGVATALLLWLGRGLTFFADEWAVIGDRPLGLDTFIRPFNEHWLGITTLVHRSMVEVIGLGSYLPYLGLLVALHAIVVADVYVIARRSTLPAIAAGIAIVVAFFGSGFENLFWAMQIGFIGAIAFGLTALILLDHPTSRERVVGGVGLLTLGVMTSGFGLFMVAFVGLDVLLDARRRRLVPWLLVPTLVYVAWYVAIGRSGLATHGDPFTLQSLAAIPGFVLDGTAEAFSSALGVGSQGGIIALIGLGALVAYRAVSGASIPARAIASFGAIVVQFAILGLVRAQLDADAALYSRYAYLSGVLALLCLASMIGRPTIPSGQRRGRLLVASLVVVGTLSMIWNVRLLFAGRELFVARADLTRAMVELGLSQPLPAGVDPALSLVLVPSPTRLHQIVDRFGSPLQDLFAAEAVPPISDEARVEALRRATNPPDWLLAQPWLP